MKLLRILVPVLFCLVMSCGEEEPVRHFRLVINVDNGTDSLQYWLDDTSLTVTELVRVYENRKATAVFSTKIQNNDTLHLIALLNSKSHDCSEQHALRATSISFYNDSATVVVDPNINHPKELDYAVRLINSLVPDEYKLHFEDMQPAIEPTGKMQL